MGSKDTVSQSRLLNSFDYLTLEQLSGGSRTT